MALVPPSTAGARDSSIAENPQQAPQVFADLTIAVIESPGLDSETVRKIYRGVKSRGASVITPNPDGRLPDVRQCSHIISSTIDFPQYDEAIDSMVAVVSPSWATHSVSRKRAVNPRPYSPDPRHCFRDVCIFFAEIDSEEQKQLEDLVLGLGGQVMGSMTRTVTHIIARSRAAGEQAGRVAKPTVEILNVSWITHSFAQGKKVEVTSSYDLKSNEKPDEANTGPRKAKVLQRKTIYLADDLILSEDILGAFDQIFRANGAKRATKMGPSVDVYVGQFRDGDAYTTASKSSKVLVGSFTWLVQTLVFGRLVSPLSRLLYYPIPRDGIPGFKDLKMCLSNYVGDARVYLEKLIVSCGAEFTKNMSATNTHLIAHLNTSEKCQAAVAWDVKLVNHRWLEESYTRCQRLEEADSRFQEYPVLGLDDLVGQRKLDPHEVRRFDKESQSNSQFRPQELAEIAEIGASDQFDGPLSAKSNSGDLFRDGSFLSESIEKKIPPSSPPELPEVLQQKLEASKPTGNAPNESAPQTDQGRLMDVDALEKEEKKTERGRVKNKGTNEPVFLTPETTRMTTYKGSRSSKTSAPKATSPPKAEAKNATPREKKTLTLKERQGVSELSVQDDNGDDAGEIDRGSDNESQLSELSDLGASDSPQQVKKVQKKTKTPVRPSKMFVEGVGGGKTPAIGLPEPPPSTGRTAKQKALHQVTALATDMNAFAHEKHRAGGGLLGKERVRVDAGLSPTLPTKRKKAQSPSRRSTDIELDHGDDEDDDVVGTPLKPKVKRLKESTSTVPPVAHKLLVTMSDRWVDNPSREKADKLKLRSLGIAVTESPTDATVLCAPKLVRTKKFVCALAAAPAVVSPGYLDACLEFNKRVDLSEYALKDPEGEAKFGIKLHDVLKRAKRNRGKLLRGLQIFCTDGVRGGWETYRDVVAANGGVCRVYHGREELHVSRRAVNEADRMDVGDQSGTRSALDPRSDGSSNEADSGNSDGNSSDHDNAVYLLSGTSAGEKKTWEKFKAMADSAEMEPRICTVDWLLAVAMRQRLHWGVEWDLEKGGGDK